MTTSYGVPIVTVGPGQPMVHVILDAPGSLLLQQALNAVPIPNNAQPAPGLDANLAVWQPSTGGLWEFWRLSLQANGWHAQWGGMMSNVSKSPGYYQDLVDSAGKPIQRHWWGSTAAKFSAVAGVIRISELTGGYIPHALCLSLPAVRAGVWSWPAQATDGRYSGQWAIPEGAHFRIDPNLDLSTLHLPPAMLSIARAAQTYGIVIVNTGGAVGFRAEDPAQTGQNPYAAMFGPYPGLMFRDKFPWGHLQMLPLDLRTASG